MEPDWATLRRLRDAFLQGTAGDADYWKSLHELDQYDATFAQRIGWKWDFVLEDLQSLRWQPPRGSVLDWGCGSGVASRALIDHFGAAAIAALWLHDRSRKAADFAATRAKEKYPGLFVQAGHPAQVDLLIVSHVLTELSDTDSAELLSLADRATAVVWVEPGTHETSRRLIDIRERLRSRFNIVAPCPHRASCGVLASGNEHHWCHQFARPPEHVFRDAFWSGFSKTLEIDLRSLPLSYLVLDRRNWSEPPAGTTRILGRPAVHKPSATMLGCCREGLVEAELSRRIDPNGYRRLKKGDCPSLQTWTRDRDQLKSWHAWPAGAND